MAGTAAVTLAAAAVAVACLDALLGMVGDLGATWCVVGSAISALVAATATTGRRRRGGGAWP
jgi:type IV secretory pathway VirB2 component (pilin)